MDSGTVARVIIQASADTPKTISPRTTQGLVAARMAREPSCPAAAAAPFIPCLSMIWPPAEENTANSSSIRLGRVKTLLLTAAPADSGSGAGVGRGTAASDADPVGMDVLSVEDVLYIDVLSSDDRLGRMRGEQCDVLIAEQRRPDAGEQLRHSAQNGAPVDAMCRTS